MARIDITQNGGTTVVLRPKHRRVTIGSETAADLSIECFDEVGRVCRRVAGSAAGLCSRDSLQVRHHKSGRNSFSADVGTKNSNSFRTEIDEIVEIAADNARRQCSTWHSGPAQNRYHARVQI